MQAVLHDAAKDLYGVLGREEVLHGPELEVVRITLEGSSCFWTGSGFTSAACTALDGPMDFTPWLSTVPEDLMAHAALFTVLGLPSTFTCQQYASAMSAVAKKAAGEPLQNELLELVVAMAEGLAAACGHRDGMVRSGQRQLHALTSLHEVLACFNIGPCCLAHCGCGCCVCLHAGEGLDAS